MYGIYDAKGLLTSGKDSLVEAYRMLEAAADAGLFRKIVDEYGVTIATTAALSRSA